MLEPIKRVGFSPQDRQDVENMVIEAVERDPEPFILAYTLDSRSFDGRYVSADLFKEQFAPFRASSDSRNRYNAPVHNAAAVLAAEQFRRAVADQSDPRRDTVVFLTGVPGAGKTTSVLDAGKFPDNYRAVFEGQISRPAPTIVKIQQALDAGLKVHVTAVHVLPENAFANTLERFNGSGRGASINVMADIQGNLPDGLQEVHRRFGDKVALHIVDNRNPAHPKRLIGWDNLNILRSEGNHEQIKQRLTAALEQHRPNLSDAALRQARGLAPNDLLHGRAVGTGRAGNVQAGGHLHAGTKEGVGEAPVLASEGTNELLAIQGSEREQQTAVESASIEQAYQETLANYVMAKHEQAEQVEARIEGLIERQEANLQQTQTNRPGMLALPATKRAWQQKEIQQKARLHSLHQRLDMVREIKEGMGVFAPRIEEMATRKMRAEHPELASDWDAMREAGRRHQEHLRKQEKEKKQDQRQGRGKKLSLYQVPD